MELGAVSGPVEFEMVLRDQKVKVRAELKQGPRAVEVYVELFDARSGERLGWHLRREELALVCRRAGEESKRAKR